MATTPPTASSVAAGTAAPELAAAHQNGKGKGDADSVELQESPVLAEPTEDDVAATLIGGAGGGTSSRFAPVSQHVRTYLLAFGAAALAVLVLVSILIALHTPVRLDLTPNVEKMTRYHQDFLLVPDTSRLESYFKRYTALPHYAASAVNNELAYWTATELESFGFRVELFHYEVPIPEPVRLFLNLTAPSSEARVLVAGNSEPPIEADAFSRRSQLPPGFVGYSANGTLHDVDVVYVNYGRLEDFRVLEQRNVSVRGRLVLARYGHIFRGTKALLAQERGAAAVLLYSDPAEDGSARGAVYPAGPWRPAQALERGSVQHSSIVPGDPQTPNVPSLPGVSRLPRDRAAVPKIPVLPISASTAEPILRELQGEVVPRDWQGALDFAYHFGPGPARVSLDVEMREPLKTIINVVATIDGTVEPDHWVLVGNHRDAWVYGGVDPSSTSAPLVEVGRAMGQLLRRGWRPRRTVKLCSWDAEELGLIGSVEFAEQLSDTLAARAVAYLNVDNSGLGVRFAAAATPSLAALLRRAASVVSQPYAENRSQTVLEAWRAADAATPTTGNYTRPQIYPLGAGSDYVPFCHHLGIPSADVRFTGSYGVYHSIYDDYEYYRRADERFETMAALTRVLGTAALLLADDVLLPVEYREYAEQLRNALAQLRADPATPAALQFTALDTAVKRFDTAAQRLATAFAALNLSAVPLNALQDWNAQLAVLERAFLRPSGLRARQWWRHPLFATPMYGGYEGVVFPDLRHALLLGTVADAQTEIETLAADIERGVAKMDSLRADVVVRV